MLVLFNPYVTSWFLNPFAIYSPIFFLLPLAFLEGEKGHLHRAGLLALVAGLLLEDIAMGLLLYWAAERFQKARVLPRWFGIITLALLAIYYVILRPQLPHVGSEGQHLAAARDISSYFSAAKIGFLAHLVIGTGG